MLVYCNPTLTRVKCFMETLAPVPPISALRTSQTVQSITAGGGHDIPHFLRSNMQPQSPDYSENRETLNAHIMGWSVGGAGQHALCTWFVSCNSGHASDILTKRPLRVSHTHPSHFRRSSGPWFDWKQLGVIVLKYKMQWLDKQRLQWMIYCKWEKTVPRAANQSVVICFITVIQSSVF